MQIRKLVKSGHTSLVVAVPSDWIKKNELKAGDMIYMDEDGGSLKLTADIKDKPKEKKEIVIDVDGKEPRLVFYEVTRAYLKNYHHITLKGKTLMKVSKQIKEYLSSLVALELLEEQSDKIVARSFLNIADADPKALIRRMDNIVRSMITDTRQVPSNPDLVQHIIDRDKEVNRLNILFYKILKHAYSNRDILKEWGFDDMDIIRYWEVNICLEKIGDRIKNTARLISHLKARKKKALELFIQMENLYKDSMKAFYNHSFSESAKASLERQALIDNVKKHLVDNNCVTCSEISINMFILIANINTISRVVRYLD